MKRRFSGSHKVRKLQEIQGQGSKYLGKNDSKKEIKSLTGLVWGFDAKTTKNSKVQALGNGGFQRFSEDEPRKKKTKSLYPQG